LVSAASVASSSSNVSSSKNKQGRSLSRVPQPSPQLQIRANHGQLFRRIADSVPVIADSCR
jgi:hypothetical protein